MPSLDIVLVLVILGVTILLFASERLRVDVVALLLLITLVLTGLVTPEQAVSGFSNPAVITVWAVFILSGGLTATGVAHRLGKSISGAGGSERQLVIILMLVAGILSGFMNNIGVAAMMLPAVMGIARQRSLSPSQLLMPLAYATLLGGMISLIGTPGNLLISGILVAYDLQPFAIFDFTPVGITLLLVGVLFMAFPGRRLLPQKDAVQALVQKREKVGGVEQYPLHARLALLRIPRRSLLDGRTLVECHIPQALGLNILGIRRGGRTLLAPEPEMKLHGDDEVLVLGRLDRLEALSQSPHLILAPEAIDLRHFISEQVGLAEMTIQQGSSLVNHTIGQLDIRQSWGCDILAIRRDGNLRYANLRDIVMQVGDTILIYGTCHAYDELAERYPLRRIGFAEVDAYGLAQRLLSTQIPEGSPLVGQSLHTSRLGTTFGLVAIAIQRGDALILQPEREMQLEAGDRLIIQGSPADLEIIRGLQDLTVERHPDLDLEDLTSGTLMLVEATLSPYAPQAEKTLSDLQFRDKYGLNVLAIWRRDRVYFSNLGDWQLAFGDAMLLYGSRRNVDRLKRDPDFLVLEGDTDINLRHNKAPIAALVMIAVIITSIVGWLSLPIAALIGATFMVLTGCLTMDEAYRYIEWKAVFLIAGMLPLGIALEETGAAAYLAQIMLLWVGGYGPVAVMAGLFILTALLAQFMPNPVVAVLIAPIGLNAAGGFGLSPYPFLMAVALAASTSFLTPVAHPANILVMGPGSYRFSHYTRVGLPLLVLLLVAAMVTIPIFWPFTPTG